MISTNTSGTENYSPDHRHEYPEECNQTCTCICSHDFYCFNLKKEGKGWWKHTAHIVTYLSTSTPFLPFATISYKNFLSFTFYKVENKNRIGARVSEPKRHPEGDVETSIRKKRKVTYAMREMLRSNNHLLPRKRGWAKTAASSIYCMWYFIQMPRFLKV